MGSYYDDKDSFDIHTSDYLDKLPEDNRYVRLDSYCFDDEGWEGPESVQLLFVCEEHEDTSDPYDVDLFVTAECNNDCLALGRLQKFIYEYIDDLWDCTVNYDEDDGRFAVMFTTLGGKVAMFQRANECLHFNVEDLTEDDE